MQGRLETELKLEKATNDIVSTMPSFAKEWYYYLTASKKAHSSCFEYTKIVKRFLEYLSDDIKSMEPEEITLQACESFLISCQTVKNRNGMESNISNSYSQTIWCAINSFLKFLVENNYIEYNYLKSIERPDYASGDENSNKIILTQRDFNKILLAAKSISDYKQGLFSNRDVLIILIFMTTGMKKTALSEINIEDIDMNEKTLVSLGKGNKPRVYNLNEQVIDYLNKWLADREQIKTSESGTALFLQKTGERLGDDSIYNIVKKSCYKGIGKDLPPKEIRAGFCSILYKKTRDVDFVMKAAGYSTVQNAKKYIRNKENEQKIASDIMSNILNI